MTETRSDNADGAGVGSVTQARVSALLQTTLGQCGALLADPKLVELMVNEDGRVWVEWAGNSQCVATRYWMTATQRENVIRALAGAMGLFCNADTPRLSTILPGTGERFQGSMPPMTPAPGFSIRKPARAVYPLADYVSRGIMTDEQAAALTRAVQQHRNILVAGGTGSGKTTCANALLLLMAEREERIVTLEDTPELQCPAPNTVRLFTVPGRVTMQHLVQDTLRYRPDRIIMGEVRGVEAVDLMDAFATGHPGGLCTVPAGGAARTLPRMEQLIRRANIPQEVAREMLGDAQPVIAYLERTPTGRVLREVRGLVGYANGSYQWEAAVCG